MPPRVRATSLTKFSEVRIQLGFGNSRNPPAQKACTAFLDKYQPSVNVPARYFVNWRDEVHRKELKMMAETFLVNEGGGARYWPDDGSSSNRPRWEVNTGTNET